MSKNVYSIAAVHVSNIQRIHDIEIHPESDHYLFLIGGDNAAGKSSLMRAIEMALGGEKQIPLDPVRHGAESGMIHIKLRPSDGKSEPLEIERSITSDGKTTLVVRGEFGAALKAPQTALSNLIGARFLDPHEFIRLDAKSQRTKLLSLIDKDGTIAAIDASRQRAFDRRREVGRDLKKAAAQLSGLPVVEVPDPIDVAALMSEHREIGNVTKLVDDASRRCESARNAAASARRAVHEIETKIAEMKAKLETCEATMVNLENVEAKTVDEFNVIANDPLAGSVGAARRAEIEAKMRDANAHNDRVSTARNAIAQRATLAKSVAAHEGEVASLTTAIQECESQKSKLLAASALPVTGLDFDAECVRYNGVPFAQASSAESMRVALALAIAANSSLGDIMIRDGSLIDDAGLEAMRELAQSTGRRFWVERVGVRDPGALVISEGRVSGMMPPAIDPQPASPASPQLTLV